MKERVKLDSRHSPKPPSSDVAGMRWPRRSSERKRGGLPGHKGMSRTLLDEGEAQALRAWLGAGLVPSLLRRRSAERRGGACLSDCCAWCPGGLSLPGCTGLGVKEGWHPCRHARTRRLGFCVVS